MTLYFFKKYHHKIFLGLNLFLLSLFLTSCKLGNFPKNFQSQNIHTKLDHRIWMKQFQQIKIELQHTFNGSNIKQEKNLMTKANQYWKNSYVSQNLQNHYNSQMNFDINQIHQYIVAQKNKINYTPSSLSQLQKYYVNGLNDLVSLLQNHTNLYNNKLKKDISVLAKK